MPSDVNYLNDYLAELETKLQILKVIVGLMGFVFTILLFFWLLVEVYFRQKRYTSRYHHGVVWVFLFLSANNCLFWASSPKYRKEAHFEAVRNRMDGIELLKIQNNEKDRGSGPEASLLLSEEKRSRNSNTQKIDQNNTKCDQNEENTKDTNHDATFPNEV